MIPHEEGLLTYKEAAKYLGFTTRTLRSWVKRRRITYQRFSNRSVRFKLADLIDFQEKNTVKAL